MAPGELHLIDFAIPVDLDHQPLGEGVDHGGAHAVEAAGNLVAASAELAAGMEDGVNDLQSGLAGLGLDVHGDAAAVVHHGDGIALVDLDDDVGAVARQGLVDGVVHDLIHQMVETGGGRGADIHAGTFPNGLQALQDLDFRGVILVFGVHSRGVQNFVFCHVVSPFKGLFSSYKARRAGPEPFPARFSLPSIRYKELCRMLPYQKPIEQLSQSCTQQRSFRITHPYDYQHCQIAVEQPDCDLTDQNRRR